MFRGIFDASGCIAEDAPGVIRVDNKWDMADGYDNRNFVGTWQSYNNPALLKRCIWGDFRLPYSFDFDFGVGDIGVNPKYASPEWDRFMHGDDFEIFESKNNSDRYVRRYKNPWW